MSEELKMKRGRDGFRGESSLPDLSGLHILDCTCGSSPKIKILSLDKLAGGHGKGDDVVHNLKK